MNKIITLIVSVSILFAGCSQPKGAIKNTEIKDKAKYIVVAYVTSWSNVMPNPTFITHINYAFGHVNDTFNGIRIDNEERLKEIVELKKQNHHLQVLLSVGGWGSGGFSEMAANDVNRQQFALDCQRVILENGLDGVDIDWEYPSNNAGGISSSPEDIQNYTALMVDIRSAIGNDKLLTLASVSTAEYVDFRAIDASIDFVNIMAYDMAMPPKHHSPLYRSPLAGHITVEEAVDHHLGAGIPKEKLVLGMPFYGKGDRDVVGPMDFKDLEQQTKYQVKWDDTAKVPYLVNDDGEFICTFENQQSIAIKCQFIKEKGLLGGMYWEYNGDNKDGTLRKTVYNELNN